MRVLTEQAWKQATARARGERHGDRIVLTMPKRLETPNRWGSARSAWRKAAERQAWWTSIAVAYLHATGIILPVTQIPRETRVMRITVERVVRSARGFIRDDDNLHGALKPLVDALRDIGLVRDDRREWLQAPMPTQRVSGDGLDWTIVTIEPVKGAQTR